MPGKDGTAQLSVWILDPQYKKFMKGLAKLNKNRKRPTKITKTEVVSEALDEYMASRPDVFE
jgi:hypothetical protein